MSELSHPLPHEQQPIKSGPELIIDPALQEAVTTMLSVDVPIERSFLLSGALTYVTDKDAHAFVKKAAYDAYVEAGTEPWISRDLEFRPFTALCSLAKASQDASLLADAEPSFERDRALVDIALATGDTSIITSDAGRSNYAYRRAIITGLPEYLAAIDDIEDRVTAYRDTSLRHKKQGQDALSQEMYEAGWDLIASEPNIQTKRRLYASYPIDIATANRIEDPITRLGAYLNIRGDRGEVDTDLQTALADEAMAVLEQLLVDPENPLKSEQLSDIAYRLFHHTNDRRLGKYITDPSRQDSFISRTFIEDLHASEKTPRTVINAAICNMPPSYTQGTYMNTITDAMRDPEEARALPASTWRTRALAKVSAHTSDNAQKKELQQEALAAAIAESPTYSTSTELTQVVRYMNDSRVGWELLSDPRVDSMALADIAIHYKDVLLAMQIEDTRPMPADQAYDPQTDGLRQRDRALFDISCDTTDVYAARLIRHPIVRSRALLSIYAQTLKLAA